MAAFFSGIGTALRRAVGSEKRPEKMIETSAGLIRFAEDEEKLYDLAFASIDSDCDGEIGGAEGASFLKRSGLSNDQLKNVSALLRGLAARFKNDAANAGVAHRVWGELQT
jgi:hypothetical protein